MSDEGENRKVAVVVLAIVVLSVVLAVAVSAIAVRWLHPSVPAPTVPALSVAFGPCRRWSEGTKTWLPGEPVNLDATTWADDARQSDPAAAAMLDEACSVKRPPPIDWTFLERTQTERRRLFRDGVVTVDGRLCRAYFWPPSARDGLVFDCLAPREWPGWAH